MKQKVTLQTIADSLGITKVSVSKALRDQEGVSSELRQKIIETARQMGYVRKRKGADNAPKHLGFLEPRKYFAESGDFFTQVYYQLLQICTKKKIRLHLHIVSEEEERSGDLPFPFEQSMMDGIFLGGELEKSYLDRLQEYRVATLAIGFYEIHNAIDAVIVDDYYNSNQITNALIEMGHTKIGFLGDHKCAHAALDRYFGFLKGLEENGLELTKEWLISDVDEHGRNITEYTLPKNLPTAFICHSDFAAYNLRLKLEAMGIRGSDAVALATFDNTDRARDSGAVLRLDVTEQKFARTAMDRLLWRISDVEAEHQRLVINAPLIVDL